MLIRPTISWSYYTMHFRTYGVRWRNWDGEEDQQDDTVASNNMLAVISAPISYLHCS